MRVYCWRQTEFLSVSEIHRKKYRPHSFFFVEKELEIELHELEEKWHFASLERSSLRMNFTKN
jgi:hypothetical protein